MTWFRILVAGLVCLSGLSSEAADNKKADPREKVDTAVAEAIRLLEAKEYVAVIMNFAEPEVIEKITTDKPIEDIAKEFGQGKADELLKTLKSIKDLKPALEDEGTKAIYPLKEKANGKMTITFVKLGKYWYIKD